MSKSVKYTWVTEKDYDQVKGLIGYGLTMKQISDITKRGSGTLALIKATKDYADYKHEREAIRLRTQAKLQKRSEQIAIPVTPSSVDVELLTRKEFIVLVEQMTDHIDQLTEAVNALLHQEDKEYAHARVNFFKFGRKQ